MAIGNPVTLTSNVASKTISVIATAGQTLFTVTGGYRINQLAVFRNGVRLLDSRDYEARNGSTVTLLSAATVGDALEFQVFDDFRVADAIVSAESEQTISGNLTVSGILTATDLRGSDVTFRHVKATGISTVSDTTQSTTTTTGALIVSGGVGVAKNLFVGGSMNVAGTLTYEDVTNSETAGVTTTGGLVVTGLGATFGSGVGIADSIYHIDDSNTAIRFPAADTFAVETAGSEALRVDSSQRLLLGLTAARSIADGTPKLQVEGTAGTASLGLVRNQNNSGGSNLSFAKSRSASLGGSTIVQDDDTLGSINFAGADGTDINSIAASIIAAVDGTPGGNDMPGRLVFKTTADGASSPTERLRITSAGRILKGITTSRDNFATNASGADVDFQIEGTNFPSSSLSLVRNSNDANDCSLIIGKTRATSTGGSTVVQAGDDLGDITFAGADGTSLQHGANIVAEVQSGVGNDDMPTDLIFKTNGGTTSTTERLRIDSSGRVLIGSDTAQTLPTNSRLQVTGSDFATSSIRMTRFESGTSGPSLLFAHSRGTESSQTILSSGDEYGKIRFYGHDGTNTDSLAAEIKANVDGTPGTDDVPGRLTFHTTPDGSNTPTERMRIHSGGTVTIPNGITLGTTITSTAAGNTLHDYEEGTFTATCANSVTLHSDTDLLQYVKIGSSVTVMGQIRVNSSNSGSSLTISNLPFAVYSSGEGSAYAVGAVRLYSADMASDHKYVICIADGGSTNLQFQGVRDNNTSQGLGASDNGYYMFSITYRTSA